MARTRAAPALLAVAAVAVFALSGGSSSDPRTPPGLPGLPPPFLTAAVVGSGGLAAGIDSYGDVVDLRAGPAGAGLIADPLVRQEAGTVPTDTGIVPRVSLDGGPPRPLWAASSVHQRYLPGTDVLRTSARFDGARVRIECAALGPRLGCVSAGGGAAARVSFGDGLESGGPDGGAVGVHLDDRTARRIVAAAAAGDRRWLARARPLGGGAPGWARSLYSRSLLVLRALTDRRSGAVAAGARDGWAYVWPRDAGAAALALAAGGYRAEARRVARFLLGLDLTAAARYAGDGTPVPGRAAQGDAAGWVAAAARATGLSHARRPGSPAHRYSWRNRPDYQEKSPGDYLANAIASDAAVGGLSRRIGDPTSGLDSAAAWAVRPFPRPALFAAVRRTLNRLVAGSGRFGIVPSEDWPDAAPWTAPTAWSAWSLAALGERRRALRLLGDLRRASSAAGLLPERVGAGSGLPLSTTPLAWSHAFAILAIRQLWPRICSGHGGQGSEDRGLRGACPGDGVRGRGRPLAGHRDIGVGR